jgi:hypothetical protein
MIRVEVKSSARKRIKGMIVALAVVGGVALVPASSATAHVHGITPLRCVGVADDGANQVDNTPASAVIPAGTLIPRDLGNPDRSSPINVGDGGFDTPACPAD